MLGSFIKCIEEQMAAEGFGPKRTEELKSRFLGLAENYRTQGIANPADAAVSRVFAELHQEQADRVKLKLSDLSKMYEREDAFNNFNRNKSLLPGEKKADEGRVAVSMLEDDSRSKSTSFVTEKIIARGRLWATMADVLDRFGKGNFGVQRGKAHMDNVVHELAGTTTGDAVAHEIAQAWKKTADASVDMFNMAGGVKRKLDSWMLPQAQSAAKLLKEGFEAYRDFHMRPGVVDWTKTVHMDGAPILQADRERVLKYVYDTKVTNGANKIDPTAMRGKGSALGNQGDIHRFIHYDGAAPWLEQHARYGDGNVFDVMSGYVEQQAHEIALVRKFGSNPEAGMQQVAALARSRAAELGPRALAEANATLSQTYDKMTDAILHKNPMDPHGWFGNSIVGLSNILTGAQLGSASLIAIPGDFVTAAAVRAFNGMDPFAGVSTYIKALATDRPFMERIAAQSGFVMDESVRTIYEATRFSPLATHGPAITRRISDVVIRASMMNTHTAAARFTAQAEFMGLLARSAKESFEDLPFIDMMKRHGITSDMWDAMRQVKPWSPRSDVNFLRPLDMLSTGHENADNIFRAFQGMIFDESRKMVPDATVEAAVKLKDTTRADTLPGAVLQSFAMYKNFPITMLHTFGRLAMTSDNANGRMGFLAGLGAALTLTGAMASQMREIAKGRDPPPMNTPQFWGKALLSGGAMGVWGDFLFTHVNEYGHGPAETFAGPLAGWLGDTVNLVAGDAFQFAKSMDGLHHKDGLKAPARLVEYMKRYTPGSNIWWARAALERHFFDRMAELADPQAYSKAQQRVNKRQKETGVGYYWGPGENLPSRAPDFGGMFK